MKLAVGVSLVFSQNCGALLQRLSVTQIANAYQCPKHVSCCLHSFYLLIFPARPVGASEQRAVCFEVQMTFLQQNGHCILYREINLSFLFVCIIKGNLWINTQFPEVAYFLMKSTLEELWHLFFQNCQSNSCILLCVCPT